MILDLKEITFVIVSYKAKRVIFDCINSLPKFSKIIVVENSYDQELKKELEAKYDNIEVMLNENIGMGASNNIGIKKSNTNYVFILNPEKEVARLRKELSRTVTELEAMATDGNISAEEMDIVRNYLRKIGGLDRVTTSAEGIVFIVDGMSYKFTGNFAPLNQILGLFKYGAGSKKLTKESLNNPTVITESCKAITLPKRPKCSAVSLIIFAAG